MGEYCKQVDGAGVRIEGYGAANFITQLGDVSTLVRVEMLDLYSVGKLSHASELIVSINN